MNLNDARERYRQFAQTQTELPVFFQPWWLDAAAGSEDWSAAIVERSGRVDAVLPFVQRRKFGMTMLTQPLLTPTLGPWTRPSTMKYAKMLGQQKDLMEELIDALPPYDFYRQNWLPEQVNWLPFYWRGFRQTTRYTYRLEDLSDVDGLWEAMHESVRREIRKARNRFGLSVEAIEVDAFIKLNALTFARQGMAPPSAGKLRRILEAACARDAIDLWGARAPDGGLHAGACILRGPGVAYYLMGGADPDLRMSGAGSLVIWEAIRRQGVDIRIFDFEGSMIQPIERYFRNFGARQTPFFTVLKAPTIRGRLVESVFRLRQHRRNSNRIGQ